MSEDTLEGGCHCGAVGYEVARPFKFIAHDHCSICRRVSGAPFVTWLGVKEPQFRLLRGEEALTSYASTPEAVRQFCRTCGSHLFFRSEHWPGEVHVTVATLRTPFPERPTAHVFFSDRAEWLDGADALPHYGGETGVEPLD